MEDDEVFGFRGFFGLFSFFFEIKENLNLGAEKKV